MSPSARRTIVLLAFISLALPLPAKDAEPDPWLTFVPGRFAVVGRAPDGGAPYAGEAAIEVRGNALFLTRKVGNVVTTAKGAIEVPQPPGEGKVLRFRWEESSGKHVMTCLVASDLDNYARLSCLWVVEGKEMKSPGLEAYFSSEGWEGS